MAIGDVPELLRGWERFFQSYRDLAPDVERAVELEKVRKSGDDWQNQGRDVWRFYAEIGAKLRMFPKASYAHGQRLKMRDLFLALLQQYNMPAPIRKKVEKAAQFWAKTRMSRVKDVEDGALVYHKLMGVYEDQIHTAKDALAQGEPRGTEEDGAKILNAGPFKVVNTGHFDQETMETSAAIVKEAAGLLQSKGLGKVCYGEVFVSNRLDNPSTLAFYHITSDEMFIRTDLKRAYASALKTVLHELGHRYYYKFAKAKHGAIHNLYSRLKGQTSELKRQLVNEVMEDPQRRPQPGDTYDNRGVVWVVDEVRYKGLRSGYQIQLHDQNNPKNKGSLPVESWIQIKGYKLENAPSGFVTPYASTKPEEMFAEMFAFYCLGGLPAGQDELFRPLLD